MTDPHKYVLGIDLGTSKVVAVLAELTQDNYMRIVSVRDIASKGIHRGKIINLEQAIASVKQVSTQVLSDNNLLVDDLKAVVSTFSADNVINIISKGVVPVVQRGADSLVAEDDVHNAVERALDNLKLNQTLRSNPLLAVAHSIPIAYTLDNEREVAHPVGMVATQLEVTLLSVALPKSSMRDVVICFERAGLPIHALLFKPLATALGIPKNEAAVANNLILDMGGGTTDIAIFANKKPRYFATVPLGGDDISHDIYVVEHLPQYKAEEVKKGISLVSNALSAEKLIFEFGGRNYDLDKSQLQAIIGARIRNIIAEKVKPILLACENFACERVLLTGGVARTKGIENVVAVLLDLPTKRVFPAFEDQLVSEKYNESYVTSMGILKYIQDRATLPTAYVDDFIDIGASPWKLSSSTEKVASDQEIEYPAGTGFFEIIKNAFKDMF